MKNIIQDILKKAINEAFGKEADFALSAEALVKVDETEIIVDYPKNEAFGDYTTNIAMLLGKSLKRNPMEIAEEIVKLLNCYIVKDNNGHSERSRGILKKILTSLSAPQDDRDGIFEKIEVVAPGYINFYLSKKYLQSVVEKISKEKENFGSLETCLPVGKVGNGMKIDNEFISANPTGPLHLGNGRGGFFGDSLSKILKKAGFEVVNEYYVNDAGGQVEKLGHSVLKDSEAVYEGDYIDQLNKKYADISDIKEVGEKSAEFIVENIIKPTVENKMKIHFDLWASEKKIQDDGYVEKAIELLKEKKLAYELEGALWLKTTEFGDDKDRVLVKSDGQNAYFASDCGYLLNKIERNFDKMIMSLGADHHGYLARIKAAAEALGFKGDFRIVISQLVRLVKDGKEVRMSKRAGNVVNIDDLIDEIGHDVTRFFFLMYSPDTHMNFDLGLAKEQSSKNPVFYVQYAHARICSILTKNQKSKIKNQNNGDLSLLKHEKETELMKEINRFPELIEDIAESYEVNKMPHYAIKLADKFHSFYGACKVIDQENPDLTNARLKLVDSTRIVLAETLRLIGVSAPEKM